jgi:hypothetical protein
VRKNPGRQIRTFSQRLDAYLDGHRKDALASRAPNAGKTYFNVSAAPLSSVEKIQQSTISIPSWMFEEALADGMITHRVCFVSEADYSVFVKLVTRLKRRQKTKRGANAK